MQSTHVVSAIGREGQSLFALLGAAEASGFMVDPSLQAQWARVRHEAFEPEVADAAAASCYDLLLHLEHRGHMAETPLERRWWATRARIAKRACDQEEPRPRWRPSNGA